MTRPGDIGFSPDYPELHWEFVEAVSYIQDIRLKHKIIGPDPRVHGSLKGKDMDGLVPRLYYR